MYPRLSQIPRSYRFDGFEVDAQTATLSRQGERVPIQELPLQLLLALVERPGELVSREELQERLWPPGVHLDFEISLATAVKKARQALGDTAKEPRFIETLPGRGYRFLREVTRHEPIHGPDQRPWPEITLPAHQGPRLVIPLKVARIPAPDQPLRESKPSRVGWYLAGLGAVLVLGVLAMGMAWLRSPSVPPKPRPCVLPLPAKVIGAPESAFLCDAIPDALSTLLAGAEGMDTKVPPSSAQVHRVQGDVARIAEAYRADFLILTTVTAEGERLRLDVKLVEAPTQKIRWANHFEATRDSYNRMLGDAARALLVALHPGPADARSVGQPAFSSQVELALREGKYFQRAHGSSRDHRDFALALAAFRRAQSLAPSSALLAAEIAFLFEQQHFHSREPEALREAEQWVARALDLDPQCGKAWWVRSWIESNRPKADPEAILDFTLRAARYAPNEASTYVAIACEAPTSNFAVTAGKRAIELDPLDPGGYFVTAFSLALAGRAEEGLSFAERGLWLGAAKEELTWAKFLCLFHAGHYAEARRVIPVAQSSEPVRLMHFIMDGDRDGGRAYAKALVAKWRQVESGAEDWVNRRGFCGPLFLRLGMHAELLWLLEKSTDAGGPPSLEWFFENSEAGQLHDDPRFKRAFQASRAHGRLFLRLADAARARGEYPGPLEVPLVELRALLERHPAF